MERRYRPQEIEQKWQRAWRERDVYRTPETSDKPKYYCLDFFPYPSGDGLSVGHCRNYVPTDAVSRFMRLRGYNVLHPMGWDAFGLPAENYAIKRSVHPRVTTEQNIATYKRQMDLLGLSYDWSREISSIDPDYYRWTQWFFLLMYERGLAYRAAGLAVVVSGRQDDPGQRAGGQRTLLALRHRGHQGRPRAVVLQDHRLRAAAARRPGDHRLAGADQAHAGQLDRAQRGRRGRLRRAGPRRADHGVHDASRHALRRHLHGAGARASAGRRAHDGGAARGGRGVSGPRAPRERDRAPLDREGEDRRLHRRVRREPGQRARRSPSGSRTTC